MQVVSFASLNADKHMVVKIWTKPHPTSRMAMKLLLRSGENPRRKRQGQKEKKGKTGKKESASSEEEEASAPPSPPASPPPSLAHTRMRTSGSGSTLSPGK